MAEAWAQCTISLGPDGDKDAPVAALVWLNEGPGDPLRGRHSHSCDAINLVVQGAMYMDGIWLRPGQAKIVPSGTNYGDAVVTGGGCIFIELFGDHHGAKPITTSRTRWPTGTKFMAGCC